MEKTERQRAYSPRLEDESRVIWRQDANCLGQDIEIFYPEHGQHRPEALQLCKECDVQIECLAYALLYTERLGIWGGMGERERRPLRRKLRSVGSSWDDALRVAENALGTPKTRRSKVYR